MKMAISEDGTLYLKDLSYEENLKVKSWGLMKYDSKIKMYKGPVSYELLKRIQKVRPLSPEGEQLLRRYKKRQTAVDYVRNLDSPKEYIKAPVKGKLYSHQIKAYDMALIVFGVVSPDDVLPDG